MTTLLRVDASFRIEGSVSRGLADSAQAAWEAEHPNTKVVRRDLGLNPLPADAWASAVSASFAPADTHTPQQRAALMLASALLDELLDADATIVAVPLYNYGISQHVKTWIDLLLADPRLRPGAGKPLIGRPAIIALARGGGYGPGTPREGWDHATPYLQRIFGDVLKMDVRITAAELTLAPVKPELADLIDLSKQSEAAAHEQANAHAQEIARRLALPAA
ncbi:FMN-dependent NADH-azoreductase [Kribbella deserti]|uniref:FMN dependent NADH:quinone oxidoreductase n=1 Tax=Kribbella deserti TaxID=1926257 RepID=A0ABV6QKY5_9ACTN